MIQRINEMVHYDNKDLMKAKTFTTSREVAEVLGKDHQDVKKKIEKLLESGTEYNPVQILVRGKVATDYILNKKGFILLIMNYEGYNEFKRAYIDRFDLMEKELEHTRAMRAQGIDIRCNMTDAIKTYVANDSNKQFIYAQYTNLIYKHVFNSTAKQLREGFGVKTNGALRDVLKAEKLEEIASLENKIAVLIEFGMSYETIKAKLNKGAK